MSLFSKPLKCFVGLHRGSVRPAFEIEEHVDGYSAFVCVRCGEVIE